jgi:hypothetical protein
MIHELSSANLTLVFGGQDAGNFNGPCNLPQPGVAPTLRQQAGQAAAQLRLAASDDPVLIQRGRCQAANDAGIGFDFAQQLTGKQAAP